MKKNSMQIYSLSICLITTMIILVGLIGMIGSTLEMLIPEKVKYASIMEYDSNEAFKDGGMCSVEKVEGLNDQQIEDMRIKEKAYEIARIKAVGLEDLLSASIWVFVSLIAFLIHLKVYRKVS